jgi:hypothetical protein
LLALPPANKIASGKETSIPPAFSTTKIVENSREVYLARFLLFGKQKHMSYVGGIDLRCTAQTPQLWEYTQDVATWAFSLRNYLLTTDTAMKTNQTALIKPIGR